MTATPSKRSTLERRLDYLILLMFSLLACLCIVDAVGASIWVDKVTYRDSINTTDFLEDGNLQLQVESHHYCKLLGDKLFYCSLTKLLSLHI